MPDETKAISLENLTEFKEKCDLAYEPRKNIPTPTSSNNGQVLGVENGNFVFVNQSGGGGGGDYTLPVASPNTLGGVKPVAKTDDMTQSVGVDSNGALWTEPSDGGSGGLGALTWNTATLTASSTGTQINLNGVYICYILASESGSPVFLLNFGVCCFRTGSSYNNTYQCAISITTDSQATPNLSELVSISYQGNTMYLGNASSIGVDTLTLYYAKIADL